jgi:hypothetical protein
VVISLRSYKSPGYRSSYRAPGYRGPELDDHKTFYMIEAPEWAMLQLILLASILLFIGTATALLVALIIFSLFFIFFIVQTEEGGWVRLGISFAWGIVCLGIVLQMLGPQNHSSGSVPSTTVTVTDNTSK